MMLKHKKTSTACETTTTTTAAAASAVALAELAWDGESNASVVAVVREPAHVHLLTHTHRLVGAVVDREAAVLVLSSPVTPVAAAATSVSTHSGHDDTEHATKATSTNGASTPSKAAHNTSSAVSSATVLRLRLEEIYVGLCHGFLALHHSKVDTHAFTRALLDAVQRPSTARASAPIGPSKQHRLTLCT